VHRFIVFEGLDRSGKTTQAKMLEQHLKKQGKSVVLLREPGGTPAGEKIRTILKDHKQALTPLSQAMLFMASRAELVAKRIKPALDEGQFVILDRYYFSTCAYQGAGSLLGIYNMLKFNDVFIIPDIVFLLDIDPKKAFRRVGRKDRFERYPMEYHKRVRNGFLQLARMYPQCFVIMDSSKNARSLHQRIVEQLDRG
jgi:dTMP kinase